MQSPPLNKIYLADSHDVTFGCTKCGQVQKIDIEGMLLTKKGFRFRCKCNELYDVEFRKEYRKHVKIAAKYDNLSRSESGEAIIENISMGGIGLTVLPRTQFKEGDLLRLDFLLDNLKRTNISLDVRIKHIDGHKVGAEIHDWHYNQKDIGYYLFP